MERACTAIKRYNHLLGEIEGVYHEISLQLGLSDSVSKILYTLCVQEDRCPLSVICRQTGLSKQTVNSAIRKLEQQGMVLLEPVSGKSKDVLLTEAGKELARRTARRIIEMENSIFQSWDQEDVQRYLHLTEGFLRALEQKAQQL
jgi:DNA-binding MarR family transcriptional regulator